MFILGTIGTLLLCSVFLFIIYSLCRIAYSLSDHHYMNSNKIIVKVVLEGFMKKPNDELLIYLGWLNGLEYSKNKRKFK
jgi:hypothetical protein